MNKLRGQRLRYVANQLQMEYQAADQWGVLQQLQDFQLFRRGFRGRVRHLLRKQDGLMESNLNIFDYRYLKWAGKSSKRVEQTVFFLESQQLALPEFFMHPEHFFHKIGKLLGIDDINFQSHPDFSYHYHLTGEDEQVIRHQFNPQVLRFFSLEKGWTMEGLGFYLVLYKKGKVIDPKTIRHLYEKGQEVYEALKQE